MTSVPHSGTQFFHAILKAEKFAHFTSPKIDEFIGGADHVAVAVRHPALTWRSWFARGKHTDNYPPVDFWRAYSKFGYHYGNPKLHYLPIDHPSRDERFAALAKKLNRPIIPDWNHFVGDLKKPHPPTPEVDLSPCFDVPILQELYGE